MVETPTPTPKTPEKIPSASDDVLSLGARVRIGEERSGEVRKKLLLLEQNMLSNHKRAMSEVKLLQTEMNELKRGITAIEDRIITIIKELRLSARKEDIDIMKKYLDLWDPVKFVTHERVEALIDEKLGKHDDPHEKPNYDSPT